VKDRSKRIIVAGIASVAVLLLLVRLAALHGAWRQHPTAHSRSHPLPLEPQSSASFQPGFADSYGDGTPDFARLRDPADQSAFRQWFTLIANYQAVRPASQLPAEITDCASLLRMSYREALRRHDAGWFLTSGMDVIAPPGEVRAWNYPNSPLGANLFRVREGSFQPSDLTNGSFAQFADARTLVQRNSTLLSRDVRRAQPGDLLFYRQMGHRSPWHSMIMTRIGGELAVVYNTGPDHGQRGEMRRVLLRELLLHPQPEWRPTAANPNFLGVYRWNILRGTE